MKEKCNCLAEQRELRGGDKVFVSQETRGKRRSKMEAEKDNLDSCDHKCLPNQGRWFVYILDKFYRNLE